MIVADARLQKSEYITPNIFGHQKWIAAMYASTIPPTITKWKWATMKYVSCRWMSVPRVARNRPVTPPTVNSTRNARVNSIGAWNVIEPRYSVAVQLNTLIALGTATSIVRKLNSR